MAMKKEKLVKLLASKRAIAQIELNKKSSQSGKEAPSKAVEKFAKAIEPFLGKKGQVLKSKLRTNKARREFNKAIADFKNSGAFTQKQRKQTRKKIISSLEKSDFVQKHSGCKNVDGKKILDTFIALSSDYLRSNFAPTSQDVIEFATTSDNISSDTIKDVAKYITNDMESRTPSFLKDYLNADDTYNYAMQVLELMDEYEEYNIKELEKRLKEEG